MISNAILSLQAGQYEGPVRIWLKKMRASENLKAMNAVDDETIRKSGVEIMMSLARWFELESGKNEIGALFVQLGKKYFKKDIPISELAFIVNLARKSAVEFLLSETDLSDPGTMYSFVETVNRTADFFQLGTYYLVKGFLEEVYVSMNKSAEVSEGVLKKYFKDEFFFKK